MAIILPSSHSFSPLTTPFEGLPTKYPLFRLHLFLKFCLSLSEVRYTKDKHRACALHIILHWSALSASLMTSSTFGLFNWAVSFRKQSNNKVEKWCYSTGAYLSNFHNQKVHNTVESFHSGHSIYRSSLYSWYYSFIPICDFLLSFISIATFYNGYFALYMYIYHQFFEYICSL